MGRRKDEPREDFNARRRVHYAENKEQIVERNRQTRKRWRDNNPDKVREQHRRNRERQTPEYSRERKDWFRLNNRASIICTYAKVHARKKGVSCDLTPEWVRERLDRGMCEMSGLPFDMDAKRGPNTPSVDRIVPSGQYTQSNCRLILWSLNRALSNYGEDYMLMVFKAVLDKRQRD
jgi:hypothetical protein